VGNFGSTSLGGLVRIACATVRNLKMIAQGKFGHGGPQQRCVAKAPAASTRGQPFTRRDRVPPTIQKPSGRGARRGWPVTLL